MVIHSVIYIYIYILYYISYAFKNELIFEADKRKTDRNGRTQ